MKFYVIAYGNPEDKRQGIFSINFDEKTKNIKLLNFYPTENKPASLIVKNEKIIMSSINLETKKGSLSILDVKDDNNLVEEANYEQEYFYSHLDISKDGKYLLGASFYEGVDGIIDLDNLEKSISTHTHNFRKRADKPIQQACHSHFIGMTPDSKYVYSVDIGTDEVLVYDFKNGIITLNKEKSLDRPLGTGPRLMPFDKNGKFAYLINELSNEVNMFSYEDGNFTEIQTISTLAENFEKESTAAGIKISENNKYLAITNRGEDSVTIYSINSQLGNLSLKNRVFTGKKPRDIQFVGDDYILVCAQDENKIQIIEITEKSILLENSIDIPSPDFIV